MILVASNNNALFVCALFVSCVGTHQPTNVTEIQYCEKKYIGFTHKTGSLRLLQNFVGKPLLIFISFQLEIKFHVWILHSHKINTEIYW